MTELTPNARANLLTKTARCAARQTNADQVQQELDADKQTLEERTAQLRVMQLVREKSAS